MANRLTSATSPYLQQHADNPVDWWEWGPQALAAARERDLPIFLSIGYAACHWCHVMAHESFEDSEIADLINRTSIPIKVDREERPDIDAVYMAATIAISGHGGWPMSVWLTPDGKPFHAGTYYPPEPRHGMPSFREVLVAAHEAWTQRRDDVLHGAATITTALQKRTATPDAQALDPDDVAAALVQLAGDFDHEHGGFGGAPKFPPSMVLDALLVRAARGDGGMADRAWQMARDTCTHMALGGIHDQLAGGFARYSTDAAWIVPHFEKMLYDNGLLLGVYGRAAVEAERRGEDSSLFLDVIKQLINWLEAEMLTPQGAFAASLDADSDDGAGQHVEGAYYVWTPQQLTDVLGQADAAAAIAALRVSEAGTFEHGTSVLQRNLEHPLDPDIRSRLAAARANRPRPGRDDKVVLAWNGWLITSLLEVAATQQQPAWRDRALAVLETIWRIHRRDNGTWARTSRDGVAGTAPAVAEDLAALAHACAQAAAATGNAAWLSRAAELLDLLKRDFCDEEGNLCDTATDAEQLYLRPRELVDAATPSASAIAVRACRSVARLTGEWLWSDWADQLAASVGPIAAAAPRAAGWIVADALGEPAAAEVVIVADRTEANTISEWVALATRHSSWGSVVVAADSSTDNSKDNRTTSEIPVVAGKTAESGAVAAFVCRHHVCDRPTADLTELAQQLAQGR